jgi:hypothetical protein
VNYQESNITGTQWRRAHTAVLYNYYGHVPSIQFSEESVLEVEGQAFRKETEVLAASYNPEGVIALRNPETDELTGQTLSHPEFYAILYSLYRQLADERDTRVANVSSPQP